MSRAWASLLVIVKNNGPASLALSTIAICLAIVVIIGAGSPPVSACDPQGLPCLAPPPMVTEEAGSSEAGEETTHGSEDASGTRDYDRVVMKGDICATHSTRMAVEGVQLSIYSDFGTTPNGMLITTLDLTRLPSITEADKALETPVVLLVKNSEYAPAWSITLYWYADHYGVTVYRDGTLFDNTGPICGWF